MEGRLVLKVFKKLGFVLLMAAYYLLCAAILAWFWPCILHDMATGQWQRRKVFIKKIHRIREQVRHEMYLRRQHEARSKRVWANRNKFYS